MADADRVAAALRYQEEQDAMRPATVNSMLARQGVRMRAGTPVDTSPAWYEQALPMEGRAAFLPFQDTLPSSVMNQRKIALPGIVAGALNAFSAPGRALSGADPKFNAEEEAANLAMNVLGGGVAVGRAPPGSLGANVWHGSPHKFDKFDSSKIGTGERAQAYGHGLYLADNPAVGGGYQKRLSASNPNASVSHYSQGRELQPLAKNWQTQSPDDFALWALKDVPAGMGNDQKAQSVIAKARRMFPDSPIAFEDAIDNAARKAIANSIKTVKGNLYKVDLPDAQIAKMLDWDKPLSQQAPGVQAAFGRVVDRDLVTETGWAKLTGERALAAAVERGGKRGAGEALLREQGIPGIRYLDGGSRSTSGGELLDVFNGPQGWQAKIKVTNRGGSGGGFMEPTSQFTTSLPFKTQQEAQAWAQSKIGGATSNYVVFPGGENMLTILERNGVPPSKLAEALKYLESK